MALSADLLEKFANITGAKGFSRDPQELEPWLTDWRGRYTGKVAAMLSPASTGEVAAIMALANESGTPVVPQGGNSGMVGGATPDESARSVLLSLRRMNRIINIDPNGRTVECQAGVILENLHNALRSEGQRFPLTLGGKGSATVGGLISTNAGGTQVLRHGTMRALVAGVEAVLPNGDIFNGLAPLKKDNRGYDLKHLLIGAEGTLGVVTAATLQTVPDILNRAVVWAGVKSPQAALAMLRFVAERAGDRLEGFELVQGDCLTSVLKHIPDTRAPLNDKHDWHILFELISDSHDDPEPADIAETLLADAWDRQLVDDAVIGKNESEAEAFWKLRDSIAEAERAAGPALQHDISVPVSAMPDFITNGTPRIEARFPGTKVRAFGHLGDGNVHYHVKAPPGSEAESWHRDFADPISTMVYDMVDAVGGSISAEHGIGQNKLHHLVRTGSTARLNALRAIKSAMDPNNICNPGKLVPLAPAA